MSIEFELIDKSADLEEIINFLNTLRDYPMTKESWDWEFNYLSQSTVLASARDNNNLIGTLFVMPIEINLFGEVILSGKLENGYFKPEYRGKKIFNNLFYFVSKISNDKKMTFFWGITWASKVFTRLEFQAFEECIKSFRLQIGVPDLGYFRANSTGRIKPAARYIFYFIKYCLFFFKKKYIITRFKYSSIKNKYERYNKLKSVSDIQNLYSKLRLSYKNFIHLDMNGNYMQWRISNNPNLNYLCGYFYKENSLNGYYMVSIKDDYAFASDFTYISHETSIVMLIDLLEHLSKLKIKFLTYYGNITNELNKNTFKLFKRFGHEKMKETAVPFIFKESTGLNNPNLFSAKNWYINGLWTEGYIL